jgi:hypothetical protein
MNTSGSAPTGIVRFDTVANTSARFASGVEFQDINVGLDGRLYGIVSPGGGVNSSQVFVCDPTTMAQTGTINPATALVTADIRGIGADATGTLYGAGWDGNLYRISSTGAVLGSVPTGTTNLTDIDLSPAGTLIAGGRFGNVFISNTSLATPTSFSTGSDTIHVAFAAAVPEPATMGIFAVAAAMFSRYRRADMVAATSAPVRVKSARAGAG